MPLGICTVFPSFHHRFVVPSNTVLLLFSFSFLFLSLWVYPCISLLSLFLCFLFLFNSLCSPHVAASLYLCFFIHPLFTFATCLYLICLCLHAYMLSVISVFAFECSFLCSLDLLCQLLSGCYFSHLVCFCSFPHWSGVLNFCSVCVCYPYDVPVTPSPRPLLYLLLFHLPHCCLPHYLTLLPLFTHMFNSLTRSATGKTCICFFLIALSIFCVLSSSRCVICTLFRMYLLFCSLPILLSLYIVFFFRFVVPVCVFLLPGKGPVS